jgi:hypothetical protein
MDAMMPNNSEIVIYQTEDQRTKITVRMEDETVWLTQAQMAELFQTTKQNVSLHISNALKEGEIAPDSVVKEYLTTAADGKNYLTKHYNLDVIISVGYRVKSLRGVQFRRWATNILREFLVKGFAMPTFEVVHKVHDIVFTKPYFYLISLTKITSVAMNAPIDKTLLPYSLPDKMRQ